MARAKKDDDGIGGSKPPPEPRKRAKGAKGAARAEGRRGAKGPGEPGGTLTLRYRPADLPSAQHRAGLAGLMVLADVLKRRGERDIPTFDASQEGTLTVTLSKAANQKLFDEFFAAAYEETESKALRKKKDKTPIPPKREVTTKDPTTGKSKTVFIYDDIVPAARFLKALGAGEPWLKLWRDVVLRIFRGVPATQIPFKDASAGKPVGDAGSDWSELHRAEAANERGVRTTKVLPSTLYIGAQAHHADRVPFSGLPAENYLLTFWPVVAGLFVPQIVDRDGNRDFDGYLIAIPDVIDPCAFVTPFRAAIADRSNDLEGYRPRESVISVPGEGALEYLHLLRLASAKSNLEETAFALVGIEYFHMDKKGNNIRTLSSGRVRCDAGLLAQYEALRGRYRDIRFRRRLMMNLLEQRPWYTGFGRDFARSDFHQFVGSRAESFARSVRLKFSGGYAKGEKA